jgi:hypothetical protein
MAQLAFGLNQKSVLGELTLVLISPIGESLSYFSAFFVVFLSQPEAFQIKKVQVRE